MKISTFSSIYLVLFLYGNMLPQNSPSNKNFLPEKKSPICLEFKEVFKKIHDCKNKSKEMSREEILQLITKIEKLLQATANSFSTILDRIEKLEKLIALNLIITKPKDFNIKQFAQ